MFVDKRSGTAGMTLVETLVTLLVSSVIFSACLIIFNTGSHMYHASNTQIELQQELREAMLWMQEDLIQTGASKITGVPADGSAYSSLTLYLPSGVSNGAIQWSASAIQFLLGGTGGTDMLRRVNGSDKIIGRNIKTVTFSREAAAPNIVVISMMAEKDDAQGRPLSDTLSFRVKVRN
jgi:Tfp pilus assembly protein PilW